MPTFPDLPTSNLSPEEEIYRDNILDHYREPHNAGTLVEYHIKHSENNPVCGDQITVYIEVDKKGKVNTIRYAGHGCAISQAAMSMLTDKIQGKTLEQVTNLDKKDILKMLGIPIGIVRMKCALLSLRTVQKGIANYKKS